MPGAIGELQESAVSVYSNPSSDIFYLRSSQSFARADIYTVLGEAVVHARFSADTRSGSIDLKGLPAGTYFVELTGSKLNKVIRAVLR